MHFLVFAVNVLQRERDPGLGLQSALLVHCCYLRFRDYHDKGGYTRVLYDHMPVYARQLGSVVHFIYEVQL